MSSISTTTPSYMSAIGQSISSSLQSKIQQSLTPAQQISMEIEQMSVSAFTSSTTDPSSTDMFSQSSDIFNSPDTSLLMNYNGQDASTLMNELQTMGQTSSIDPAAINTQNTQNGSGSSLLDVTA